jgi:hypothetical protein
MANVDDRREVQPEPRAPKKAYLKPRLVSYGNLAEVTQSAGVAGETDSGTGLRVKTH